MESLAKIVYILSRTFMGKVTMHSIRVFSGGGLGSLSILDRKNGLMSQSPSGYFARICGIHTLIHVASYSLDIRSSGSLSIPTPLFFDMLRDVAKASSGVIFCTNPRHLTVVPAYNLW
jgi:hypothetical protein